MDEKETRFAHLLQPIRDLAENWSIDISKELEEYLNELSTLTYSIEGYNQTFNFAEAALLIQGSTSIYSKKVEHLYALVYETVALIHTKNSRKKPTSIDVNGVDKDIIDDTGPDFLPLDDIMEEGNDIDLRDDEEEEDPVGVGAGGVYDDPDVQRNSKRRKKNQRDRERNATNNAILAPAILATLNESNFNEQQKQNELGDDVSGLPKEDQFVKTDYRMNTGFMSSSGALLLSKSLLFDQDAILGRSSSSLHGIGGGYSEHQVYGQNDDNHMITDSVNHPPMPTDERDDYNVPGGGYDGHPSSDDEDNGIHDDDDDRCEPLPEGPDGDQVPSNNIDSNNNNNASDQLLPDTASNQSRQQLNKELKEKEQKEKKQQQQQQFVNPWIRLDPHEGNSRIEKPFKKGKTFVIPSSLSTSSSKKDNQDTSTSSPYFLSQQSIVNIPNETLALRGSFFKELAYVYSKHLSQNRKELRNKKNNEYDENGDLVPNVNNIDQEFEQYEQENGGDGGDDAHIPDHDDSSDDDDYGIVGGPNIHEVMEENEYGNGNSNDQDAFEDRYGGDGGVAPDYEPAANDDRFDQNWATIEMNKGLYDESMSYVDMVRMRFDNYLKSAEQYLKETSLMQKMNEWNKKIVPILEEQDARPNFDIHNYGKMVLDGIKPYAIKRQRKKSSPDEIISIEEEEKDIDKTTLVTFDQITHDSPVYEVCRMFTSCLQLANNGNLEIITGGKMDDLSFHLLSLQPKHELETLVTANNNPDFNLDNDNNIDKQDSSTTTSKPKRQQAKRGASKSKKGTTSDGEESQDESEEYNSDDEKKKPKKPSKPPAKKKK
ncbi:hypothetical protein CYY_004679 [Polysphondylium violaceum]|uniref:Condensin-2 complex subunit H2 n=1 Tax=Polysphondylium violaceum TaxID=133409 RepID=A0A8J4PU87_9MYCE|nr:hypothetical protein CYY_004679 [Polysphondylium violaceum]